MMWPKGDYAQTIAVLYFSFIIFDSFILRLHETIFRCPPELCDLCMIINITSRLFVVFNA